MRLVGSLKASGIRRVGCPQHHRLCKGCKWLPAVLSLSRQHTFKCSGKHVIVCLEWDWMVWKHWVWAEEKWDGTVEMNWSRPRNEQKGTSSTVHWGRCPCVVSMRFLAETIPHDAVHREGLSVTETIMGSRCWVSYRGFQNKSHILTMFLTEPSLNDTPA